MNDGTVKRINEMTDAEFRATFEEDEVDSVDGLDSAATFDKMATNPEFGIEVEAALIQAQEDSWQYRPVSGFWHGARRNVEPISKITDRLYCGGDDYLFEPEVLTSLIERGVTHIIDCRAEAYSSWGQGKLRDAVNARFTVLHNGMPDNMQPQPVSLFEKTIDFALGALLESPTNKLYIHCAAGINRGPSHAYAVLRALGIDKDTAVYMMRRGRPCAAMAYEEDVDWAIMQLGYSTEDEDAYRLAIMPD